MATGPGDAGGDEDTLDAAEVAPLVAALGASSGDTRATILEALVRLPLAAADVRSLGLAPPAHVPPLRPPWAEAELPGFTRYPASAAPELEARLADLEKPGSFFSPPVLPLLEEDFAPAAVTHWFAWAVDESPYLGNYVVGWVGAYGGLFRPDLKGLYAQYRRAALAECAAWREDRRPGTWFLRHPDFEDWHGYRSLCWQIGWTVSRGGLRGLVAGLASHLAAEDETERAIAALLIADAADYLLTAEPPIFGGGYGPAIRPPAGAADPATLPHLLREAARAGVVPARGPSVLHDVWSYRAERDHEPAPPPRHVEEAARMRGRRGRLAVAVAAVGLVGGLALARWLFGWLTTTSDAEPPRLDEVQCTVFAPPVASPGSAILVQVFAHVPEEADVARAIALELDVRAQRRAFHSLAARVPLGVRLDFELRLPGLDVDDPVASLAWRGRTEAVQFGVRVPADAPLGTVIGTVSISREGVPLGHVKFVLDVAAAADGVGAEPQGVDASRYRFAFISYASQDRDEVLRRVQMLSVAGLDHFQDLLDLEPGQVWSAHLEQAIRESDVFLLFWSSHAKESSWVRKEVDFALACKAGDDLAPPEIRPVIIEGPPVVPPWDDLAHLHFNDRVLYFMSRPR